MYGIVDDSVQLLDGLGTGFDEVHVLLDTGMDGVYEVFLVQLVDGFMTGPVEEQDLLETGTVGVV